MSLGQKNLADGVVGMDSNGKASGVDGSQFINMVASQVGLGNVQNVDTTIAANVILANTFTPNNQIIFANDTLQAVAEKSQGQINDVLGLSEFIPFNTKYVSENGNDITGNGSYLNPYQTINQAMLDATNGTSINVFSAFYDETVTINKQISLNCANFVTIQNIVIADGSQGAIINNVNVASTVSSNGFGNVTLNNCNLQGYNAPYATRLFSAAQFADILLLPSVPTGFYIGYLDDSSNIQVYDTTNLVSVNITSLMPDPAITYNTNNQFLTITQAFMATIFTAYSSGGGSQSLTLDLNGDFTTTGGFNFNNCQMGGTQNFNGANCGTNALATSTNGWQTNIFTEFGKSVYLFDLTIIAPTYHAGGILFIVNGISWASDLLNVILYSPANDTDFTDVFAINGDINAQFGNGLGTVQQTGLGTYAINAGFHGALTGNTFTGTRIPFNSANNLFANYTATNYSSGDGYVQNALLGIDTSLGNLITTTEFRSAQTWTVTTNGNDTTGNGSILYPYQTISKAISVSASGDSINIIGNGTYTEMLNINQSLFIIATVDGVIIDGDIILNADNITLQNITYTGLCTIGDIVTPASVNNIILTNCTCSVPTSTNGLIIYGGVSPLTLNNFNSTQGIVTNDISASGIVYLNDSNYLGNINFSADLQVFAKNLGIIPSFTYSGTEACFINGALELVGFHNSGTMSLNGIQFCPTFVSNADDSTSNNTFNLQNVNFQDPASGSFFPLTQNGNCHFSIGAGVSCDPTTVFNGLRQDYSTAINMASSYVPTNYMAADTTVQGALIGIDTALGTIIPNTDSWTPADASGSTLTLTINSATVTQIGSSIINFTANITYPVTVGDLANAVISGLPSPANSIYAITAFSNLGTPITGQISANGTSIALFNSTAGTPLANATLSTSTITITGTYSN